MDEAMADGHRVPITLAVAMSRPDGFYGESEIFYDKDFEAIVVVYEDSSSISQDSADILYSLGAASHMEDDDPRGNLIFVIDI